MADLTEAPVSDWKGKLQGPENKHWPNGAGSVRAAKNNKKNGGRHVREVAGWKTQSETQGTKVGRRPRNHSQVCPTCGWMQHVGHRNRVWCCQSMKFIVQLRIQIFFFHAQPSRPMLSPVWPANGANFWKCFHGHPRNCFHASILDWSLFLESSCSASVCKICSFI